jgi:hypothetical protein
MRQRPENFNPAGEDPEATLVTPRFDETEARRAHPVVPLREAPPLDAPRAARVRGPRRSWTRALPAVALLAVAALGGAVATKVMQGSRAERVQEQTQPAPVQAAEAPQPTTPADVPHEPAPARPVTRDTRPRRARATTTATLAEPERDEAEDYKDDERRDKRGEKRREREEEVLKEIRKELKRAKGKAPRLVDVLTNPEQ